MPLESIGSPAAVAGFVVLVVALLGLDLGVLHRRAEPPTVRGAAIASVVWVALAAAFGAGLLWLHGPNRALEFGAAYLVEKALAVENLFVFVTLFAAFGIPAALQRRVLHWGVVGALVLRAVFVLLGAALLARFAWALHVFGAVLVVMGARALLGRHDDGARPSTAVEWLRRALPVTSGLRGERFVVREGGRLVATPLLLALVAIEGADVIFSIDSIPALFAITKDPFVVLTSNVFAVLGLRSMYFLLAGMVSRFSHLKTGLALVLLFVGGKMLLAHAVSIPVAMSLGVIASILGASVALSLARPAPARAPAEG